LAIQKQEWKAARDHLLKFHTLEVYHTVLKYALAVVAEELLQRSREIIRNWKGESEPFPEHARRQYMEISKDCRELQIEVDPALQLSMRISMVEFSFA
jgi:hypothetical protein